MEKSGEEDGRGRERRRRGGEGGGGEGGRGCDGISFPVLHWLSEARVGAVAKTESLSPIGSWIRNVWLMGLCSAM